MREIFNKIFASNLKSSWYHCFKLGLPVQWATLAVGYVVFGLHILLARCSVGYIFGGLAARWATCHGLNFTQP